MCKSKQCTFPSFRVFITIFARGVSVFFYHPGNWSNARGSLNVLEKGIHENHGSGQGTVNGCQMFFEEWQVIFF